MARRLVAAVGKPLATENQLQSKEIQMKFIPAIALIAYALLSMGTAVAADQPEPNQTGAAPPPAQPASPVGFGSGTSMGPGSGAGSSNSIGGGGFSAPTGGSGSQTFGAGFNQQTPGSGPFSSNPALNPALGAGGAGGAGSPL